MNYDENWVQSRADRIREWNLVKAHMNTLLDYHLLLSDQDEYLRLEALFNQTINDVEGQAAW
jgi:hypothetical protein